MAISEVFAGMVSVTSTELSLLRNVSYSSGSPQIGDGVYQTFLDLSDMIVGDQLVVTVYEKVQSSDTQRKVAEFYFDGAQPRPNTTMSSLLLINGWDITAKCLAGTSITVNWSIR